MVHPLPLLLLPSWGNVFVCWELSKLQSFSNTPMSSSSCWPCCRDSYDVSCIELLNLSVFRIFADMVDRDTKATWMWMSMWQSACVTCKQWLCVGPAEILLANIIMCHLSSEPWPRAGARQWAAASTLGWAVITTSHQHQYLSLSHTGQWSPVLVSVTTTHTEPNCVHNAAVHISILAHGTTSTTKSWGTPCLWLFFAIFFTLLCQLVWTWKAQTAAHLKSLCTVHYGRYETMPPHNTVTHPHIDPLAIVAAALFKITFTLNRYIYTIHYVTAESSIVYVCTHRFPFKRSFHIWAKSVIYTRLMQCNDLF